VRELEIVPFLGYSVKSNLSATQLIKQQFAYLNESTQLQKPFDGLDTMLLFSWVQQRFIGSDDQPMVLHYWDLRMPNILIDDHENLIA
jgi:hypothetical protein